jgi:hypothetical protein
VSVLRHDCRRNPERYTLRGSVSNTGGRSGRAGILGAEFGVDALNASFMLKLPAPGLFDVVLVRESPSAATLDGFADGFIIRRDVPVEPTAMLDFDFAQMKAASTARLTVDGRTGTETDVLERSVLVTKRGTTLILGACQSSVCPTIPQSDLQPEDTHHFYVVTRDGPLERQASIFRQASAPITLRLPPAAPQATVSRARGELLVSFPNRPGTRLYALGLEAWSYLWTPGWLGDGEVYRYQAPPLGSLSGWDAGWDPLAASHWQLSLTTGTVPLSRLFNDLRHFIVYSEGNLDGHQMTISRNSGMF